MLLSIKKFASKMNPLFSKSFFNFSQVHTPIMSRVDEMKKLYESANRNFDVFKNQFGNTSDCFVIFRVLEDYPFQPNQYQNLLDSINQAKFKTDNILLLKAKIIYRLGEKNDLEGKHLEAQKIYLKALEELQKSAIPPVLQYYQIYRQYGLSLVQSGNKEEAKEVLDESVSIINKYIAQSEDPVSNNRNSINQAKACLKLIKLDPQNRKNWLQMANNYWVECDENRVNEVAYAQTLYENAIDKKEQSPKKAEMFVYFHEEKLPTEELRQILRKAL